MQRLSVSKLHHMPVRIAYRGEISNDPADISWRLNQNVPGAGELSNPIDFCARVTLKPQVIEPRFHFTLHNDQHEDRIFAGRRERAQPNVMTAFNSAVPNDLETAE